MCVCVCVCVCVSRLVYPDPGSEGPDRGAEGPLVRRGQGRHHRRSFCGEKVKKGFYVVIFTFSLLLCFYTEQSSCDRGYRVYTDTTSGIVTTSGTCSF